MVVSALPEKKRRKKKGKEEKRKEEKGKERKEKKSRLGTLLCGGM